MNLIIFATLFSSAYAATCDKKGSFTVNSYNRPAANGCYKFKEEVEVNNYTYDRYENGENYISARPYSDDTSQDVYIISFQYPGFDGSKTFCYTNSFGSLSPNIVKLNEIGWEKCFEVRNSGAKSWYVDAEDNEITITCGCEDEGLSLACIEENDKIGEGIGTSLCGISTNPSVADAVEIDVCKGGGYITCAATGQGSGGDLQAFQFACSDGYVSDIYGEDRYHDSIRDLECAEGGLQAIVGYREIDYRPNDDYYKCHGKDDSAFMGYDSNGKRVILGGWGDYVPYQEEYRGTCQYGKYMSGFKVSLGEGGGIRGLEVICTKESDCPQNGLKLPETISDYDEENDVSMDDIDSKDIFSDDDSPDTSGASIVGMMYAFSSVVVFIMMVITK